MPPGSWSWIEESGLLDHHFDVEAFLPAARGVHGFELAALDTLQDSLTGDPE